MAFPKQIKDTIYRLLQEPTLDNFREFLKNHTGEHNSIDFKREWICKDKLAKLMLALANYGGGVVVFGVQENDDKTFSCEGLQELNAKEQVESEVKAYISTNLKYEIYDFSYQSSEYNVLNGKKFQMLVVEDTPEFLPFISHKQSTDIKKAAIYTRHGTTDELVDEQELENILKRRNQHMFPATGEPLKLQEHLNQLKTLYKNIEPTIVTYERSSGIGESLSVLANAVMKIAKGDKKEEKNPLYPNESYDEFISRMIDKKKQKIERVLDLR